MAKITITHADAESISGIECDLILTDPPFDMPADELSRIINGIRCNHLVLITTMRQLIGLLRISDWELSFDFVLDAVVPKKSRNIHQPNYTHATGAYLIRSGEKSRFNRKLRDRSDTFDNKGYWPTVIRAPRERLGDHGMAKNQQAIADILGGFEAKTVCDPFAGSGTTGFAAFQLDMDCQLIEKDIDYASQLQQQFRFLR